MLLHTIIIVVIVGIAAGMLSGLVGVGGGLIIVPALIFFLSFSQKAAQGTSLGVLMLPVGILGVIQYYKHGFVDIKVVILIGVGFIIGNFFGSKLAITISDEKLKKVFAIFMMLIAIKMLFFDNKKKISEENIDKVTTTNIKKNF